MKMELDTRNFERGLQRFQRRYQRKLVDEAAKTLEREIKTRTPVDTGGLRDSIKVLPRGLDIYVFADLHGRFQELGTPRHEPQQFIEPAVDALKRKIPSIASKAVRDSK